MRAKFGRDPTAGSKKVSFKFIIGFLVACLNSTEHTLILDVLFYSFLVYVNFFQNKRKPYILCCYLYPTHICIRNRVLTNQ